MNLYQVQSFVTVLSEGSMTAAADKLNLTQPAISQQIRNLEEELGVELLVRGVRQIKPTLQGEVLYDYAKRILQLGQQAEISVRAMGAELRGKLSVGTLNTLGIHLMSPIVGRLLKHNPKLSIRIDYGLGDELIREFKRGTLDVLIIPEVERQFGQNLGDVEKKFLLKEELWLVGSGKDTEMPQQIQLSEINRYPFVGFTKEFPQFNDLFGKALVKAHVNVEPNFESQNVGTLKRVIESGLGWGFLPSLSVKKQVRMGRLNKIHVKDFSYGIDFFYYYKKTNDTRLVDVFYQSLQAQEKS